VKAVDMSCRQCGRSYAVRAVVVRRGGGRYCSRACVNKAVFGGQKQPEHLVRKRAAALMGRVPSQQCLDAARMACVGRPISADVIDKRRASLAAVRADPVKGSRYREKLSAARRGYVHSESTKAAIRSAHGTPEMRAAASRRGKAWRASLSAEQRADYYRKLVSKKKETRIELVVRADLKRRGVTFVPQYSIDRYVADFYLPRLRLVVECDGVFWHSSPQARSRDANRDAYIRGLGHEVLRLPESCIWSGEFVAILDRAIAHTEAQIDRVIAAAAESVRVFG
jgi:very-short-patch-repair endonuclease